MFVYFNVPPLVDGKQSNTAICPKMLLEACSEITNRSNNPLDLNTINIPGRSKNVGK
jgi:hypothetical protein